jgi:alpha-ketoglutarate-dependent taurine dioxygenase
MSTSTNTTVEIFDRWLRVPFRQTSGDHEDHGDFHFRWLRHQCDQDRHPQTGERVVDSPDIPADVRPVEACLEGDALVIRWAREERTSRFPLPFLQAHAYGRNRAGAPPPPSEVSAVTLQRGTEEGGDGAIEQAVQDALTTLDRHGVAVVRRPRAGSGQRPPEEETDAIIAAFSARGLRVIPTHFGVIEDLRLDNTTNANTDQLGYTNAAIDLHTDQPFLPEPPRLQLLQNIRSATYGGENYLVDGLAAARHLQSVDRRAFELLTSVPVRFHRRQKAFESLVVAPILDFSGATFRIRSSYFTMDPYDRPFDEMEDWYRAYDRFAELVRHRGHQLRVTLEPGDFLVYDNHRMLHARTGFRGPRWVRGIYFDREESVK